MGKTEKDSSSRRRRSRGGRGRRGRNSSKREGRLRTYLHDEGEGFGSSFPLAPHDHRVTDLRSPEASERVNLLLSLTVSLPLLPALPHTCLSSLEVRLRRHKVRPRRSTMTRVYLVTPSEVLLDRELMTVVLAGMLMPAASVSVANTT